VPTRAGLRGFGLVGLALGTGCHASPSEASAPAREKVAAPEPTPQPAPEAPRTDAVPIRGTVTAIRMHNINKALGHYTYNVEIELRHEGVARAGTFDPKDVPSPLVVRVDKVFWDDMSQADREAVAPTGPAQELTPARWKDLEVGQVVDLDVTFTSPSLAHRVR
jgi:hypothetical protein